VIGVGNTSLLYNVILPGCLMAQRENIPEFKPRIPLKGGLCNQLGHHSSQIYSTDVKKKETHCKMCVCDDI
jgi:hypothetical protein